MNKMQLLSVACLIFGESLAIYAEIAIAKGMSWRNASILYVLSTAPLLAGYKFGAHGFENMWIVFVVSVTSILIVEPALLLMAFRQTPTAGAIAGLACGVVGMFLAVKY